MRHSFIITAVGADRAGIVADLAEMIFDLGCNLEESNMARLGSEFAMMLLATGQGDDLEQRFRKASRHLEHETGMTIFVRPVVASSGAAAVVAGRTCRMRTLGEDKAGIVARTARAVASAGGSIVQLVTSLRPAAGSGASIYEMDMTFALPAAADVDALRTRFDAIENELNVEITLTTE